MTDKNNLRVILDQNAKTEIDRMESALRAEGKHLKVNSSKLASWIISYFAKNHFEKSKVQIIQDHFNSKEYLKEIARKFDGSEDSNKLLFDALEVMKQQTKKTKNVYNRKKEKIQKENELKGV